MTMKTMAVMTSGGDAPGMNAAIRAVTRTAIYNKLHIIGIRRGYTGLIENEVEPLSLKRVGGIINRGGTTLLTSRSKEFMTPEGRKKAYDTLKKHNIDGLIVIGGDGSMRGANALQTEFAVPTLTIPGTIDNDMYGSDYSIGFFTAVETALDAIDKIRDTATSHERLFVIEVMGHHCGNIALITSIAGGAEGVFIPEEKTFDLKTLLSLLQKGRKRGKLSSIVITAEGAYKAAELEKMLKNHAYFKVRAVTLGHVQRGGVPNAFDRLIASILGKAAVDYMISGKHGGFVGLDKMTPIFTLYSEALTHKKAIDEQLIALQEILAI